MAHAANIITIITLSRGFVHHRKTGRGYAMFKWLAEFLAGPLMLTALGVSGVYFLAALRMRPVLGVGGMFARTLGRRGGGGEGGLSAFAAFCTSLAATAGVGNIAGVATAVSLGGPGALFWLWAASLGGMAVKYAETSLAVRWRERGEGGWRGGSDMVMARALGKPALAAFYRLALMAAALTGGMMIQTNAMGQAVEELTGMPRLWSAAVCAGITAVGMGGGLRRVSRLVTALMPVLAVGYLLAGTAVVAVGINRVPAALAEVFSCAFGVGAAGAGMMGAAVRYGVARGMYSNEAGLGAASIAYSAAGGDAHSQGEWSVCEVAVDTLFCLITGVVLLIAGPDGQAMGLEGAALSAWAFRRCLGGFGGVFVAVATVLFAAGSVWGWGAYGVTCCQRLLGQKGGGWVRAYTAALVLAAGVGAAAPVNAVWLAGDVCNALIALPNLWAVFMLRRQVRDISDEGDARARLVKAVRLGYNNITEHRK